MCFKIFLKGFIALDQSFDLIFFEFGIIIFVCKKTSTDSLSAQHG